MRAYLLRRLLQMVLTLLVFMTCVFFLLRATGNPAIAFAPADATTEDIERIARGMGLDRPLYVQYGIYLRDIVTGNLGQSLRSRLPVRELLIIHTLNSFKLALATMIIVFIVSIPLGVIAAIKRFTITESLIRVFTTMGMSVPVFWLGIVLIELFSVQLGWLPVGGMRGPSTYILPALTHSTVMIAGIVRMLRSSMIDASDSDFVRFARMKGVPERLVVWRHTLRNALLPVLGYGGVQIALFLTGSVVVETVFSWPGVGRMMYTGLVQRDFPVVQGSVLLFVFFAIFINTVVDILNTYLDPRIRLK